MWLQAVAVCITRKARTVFQPDVIIVGRGLVGLACATAVAREGRRVRVVSSSERGAASGVSAGILAPSVGSAPAPARRLGLIARDLYPEYLGGLVSRTGRHVSLDRTGVLEVALDETEAISLRERLQGESRWVEASTVRRLEPSLARVEGAAFHPCDGAVNAAALLDAVSADAERDSRVTFSAARVIRVHWDERPPAVQLESGERIAGDVIVLAAGAWVGSIQGLPRSLPVVPVRGQILVFDDHGPRHVVMGERGYLVSRGNQSLAGSTMENVGFDAATTDDGAAEIRGIALELSPSLGGSAAVAHWAGLRPVTPDLLPIVGREPQCDGLIYACGHSKNGVLLAPLTGQVIADLVARGSTAIDVGPYAPERFRHRDR
jgi:glycine oxidase